MRLGGCWEFLRQEGRHPAEGGPDHKRRGMRAGGSHRNPRRRTTRRLRHQRRRWQAAPRHYKHRDRRQRAGVTRIASPGGFGAPRLPRSWGGGCRKSSGLTTVRRWCCWPAPFPTPRSASHWGTPWKCTGGTGRKPLESAGLTGRVMPEPGFLVVMKKLRRAEKPMKSASRSAAGRNARNLEEQLSSRWFALGERITGAMCQRFREAATAAENRGHRASGAGGDGPGGDGSGEDDKLLPPPHPGGDVVAAYRVDWPGQLDEKSLGQPLSPLRVRYLRTTQMAKPITLLNYYRRQVPGVKQRLVANGVWLDGFSAAAGEETEDRSVDVFITAPGKGAAAPAHQPQRLVVDVLVVSCEGHAAQNQGSEKE